jgi:hypothetical protein
MNLETIYPELKEMKSSEIFIEWAYIVRDFKLDWKIHMRRIIPKAQQAVFIKSLKMVYNVEDKEENGLTTFERINLVTIEK